MKRIIVLTCIVLAFGCNQESKDLQYTLYQTSAAGDNLKQLGTQQVAQSAEMVQVEILPDQKFQNIQGFGGAFTESSAYLLNQLSSDKRDEILKAYFSENGANYSLTRTHINSCDFSLTNYSYAPLEGDTALSSFSIDEDGDDIIPMIKDAQAISKDGFRVVSSPWTAPPWMKDNKTWFGGKLLPEYYATWAKFFSKYIKAYEKEGIPIWAITVENEPLGNGANWESMHYTPHEMADFIKEHLAPQLKRDSIDVNILVYDQNRGKEMDEWIEVLLKDPEVLENIYGTAVHWYTSTYKYYPESLNEAHDLAPNKHVIHTEGCIDAEVPHWKEDKWYWQKEATDWGFDWAPEEDKADHPKYVPTYRYARDIIGCMNNWVEGWIDWNMVLDTKGGPNHAKNWCIAPIIVNPDTDEIYYTPLYYVLSHFSKFIRPGATRIGWNMTESELMLTAFQNPDGSYVVVALNMSDKPIAYSLKIGDKDAVIEIAAQGLQTITI